MKSEGQNGLRERRDWIRKDVAFGHRSASQAAGAAAIFIGALVLVGWAFNIPALKSVLPGLASMKPNTAAAFVLAGLSLELLWPEEISRTRRLASYLCASAVTLMGVLTLAEYAAGWNLGIDELLFRQATGTEGASLPGRMAPATALGFTLLGMALLLLDRKRFQGAQLAAFGSGFIGLLGVVGYAYGVKSFYGLAASYTTVALHTAATFMVLALGVLWARPARGVMALIASDTAGGSVARVLLPPAVTVPFLLGGLRLWGQRAGLYGTEFGLALFALSNSIVFATLVVWNARTLHRTDLKRRRATDRLEMLHKIDQGILTAQSPEAVAAAALRHLWNVVRYRRATFVRYDFDANEATALAAHVVDTTHPVAPGTRFPLDTLGDIGDMLNALRQGKVYEQDMLRFSDQVPAVQVARAAGIRTTLVVPLIAEAQLIGALHFGLRSADVMMPEDLDVAREVADQVAIAIQQAELRRNLQRHSGELEQRVAEQTKELQAARDSLEVLVAMSPSIIFETDLRGGRVTYSSPNVERIVGYVREELQAFSSWEEHVHPEDRVIFDAGIQEAIGRKAGQFEQEYRFLHKDGSALWLHSVVRVAYDQAGQPTTIFGYTRDVTARKAKDAALEQAQLAADRANQAKSEFLSRMSHELRTPLNAILGFGQLLEMDDPSPENRERVAQILKAGRHLLDLINEVLDIARIEAGRMALSPEAVGVSDALQEVLDLIHPLAAQRSCRVAIDTPCASSVHVLADRQRLKQVLLNLLSNAVKYNREGGTVSIVCEDGGEDRLRIKVTDTGRGIPPEMMHHLFSPFMRLDPETANVEGTGLGLALSKGLVETMGGTLGAESTVGQGSTFWVDLPRAVAPAEQLRDLRQSDATWAALKAQGNGEARTILCIEDNLSNVKLLKDVLSHRPTVRLLTAMQGRLGLDLAREHHPDLVLLDLHLPDMHGIEVLRQLQENPKTHDVPVVVISADVTPGQIQQLTAAGCRAYLTKPLDVRKLLVVLDDALEDRAG